MSKEKLFSPKEQAAISTYIKEADKYRNAMVFGQALMNIAKQFNRNPLRTVESLLRIAESDTYLVARPTTELDDRFLSSNPGLEGQRAYYLWICVNGKEEQAALLAMLQVSQDENLSMLDKCGFLSIKEGSEAGPLNRPRHDQN